MFLASLEKTLKSIIFNPLVVLPMLLASIFSYLSMEFTGFVLERPITDMVLYYDSFTSSDLLGIILHRYMPEILIMVFSGLLVLFVTIVCALAVTNFALGIKIGESINKAVLDLKKSLSLTFFIAITGFLTLVLFLILNNIFIFIHDLLPQGIDLIFNIVIFPLFLLILLIILITKLGFVFPALLDNNIREAIKKSWEFTNNNFWISFILIIITFIIAILIVSISDYIGVLIELSWLFWILGEAIALTFIVLSISFYYFNNQ
jgi:hypothetical protein